MSDGHDSFTSGTDLYHQHVGRYGAELAAKLLVASGVQPGQRALDVGCGPGPLTAALADVLGAEHVAAVDPSKPMVGACRARVPGADIRQSGAESLPFADHTFDVVLAQLVVNFMSDALTGVREMRRVAKPGGTVAACVWDYAGEMTFLRRFWDAAVALDPVGAGPCDEGVCMRFCSETELQKLWQDAGLSTIETGALVVSGRWERFDELWAPLAAGLAPSGAYTASLDETRREALRVEFHRRLGAPSGAFELGARAWFVCGMAGAVDQDTARILPAR
jgi:SAM-dependent methyltransferase